jgi:hypothetical protein
MISGCSQSLKIVVSTHTIAIFHSSMSVCILADVQYWQQSALHILCYDHVQVLSTSTIKPALTFCITTSAHPENPALQNQHTPGRSQRRIQLARPPRSALLPWPLQQTPRTEGVTKLAHALGEAHHRPPSREPNHWVPSCTGASPQHVSDKVLPQHMIPQQHSCHTVNVEAPLDTSEYPSVCTDACARKRVYFAAGRYKAR